MKRRTSRREWLGYAGAGTASVLGLANVTAAYGRESGRTGDAERRATDGPASVEPGSAQQAGDGAGQPYLTVPFESDAYTDGFTQVDDWNADNRSITSQTRQGTDLDRSALQVAIPEGENWGTILRYAFGDADQQEPEELYARYHVYFPEGFSAANGGGLLPGPAGVYGDAGRAGNPSDGTNGWSARGSFRSANTDDGPATAPIRPEYFVYHADMDGQFGDRWAWDTTFERGQWYRIDQYVRMNTPGENDGVLGAWVDGEQAFGRNDLRFRNEGYAAISVKGYWFTFAYGGEWTSPTDNAAYFSRLTLSSTSLS